MVIVNNYNYPSQDYPATCNHDGHWVPDGIELDNNVIFIEDDWYIPVRCEKCGVGTNLSHNRTLKDGKIV